MRIHPLSDLHNEFAAFTPEVMGVDVVILAGDIDLGVRGIEWARQAFDCPKCSILLMNLSQCGELKRVAVIQVCGKQSFKRCKLKGPIWEVR